MKIFSTFDTNLKQKRLEFYQKKYGENNVHMIQLSKIFFLIKILLPIIQWLLFTTFITVTLYYLLKNDIAIWAGIIAWSVFSMIFYLSSIKHYIDMKMDYCIVTPEEVILTEQEWILNRTVRTLDANKVKSIYINKKNLLYSIFDNGTIVFMSDGDEQFGEITFEFIYNPEYQKDIIQNIISLDRKWKE